MTKKLTDKQKLAWANKRIKSLEKKVLKARFSKDASYDAFQLRKSGMTWKKIAKKLNAPESTVRLATQRRFKASWLKGRWSDEKLDVSERIDVRTRAMLADAKRNPLGKSYEEYIRQKY